MTLDFNNFYIAGPVGNAAQQVFGVYAYERSNVTVKNGTIAYCFLGIFIYGNGQATTNSVGARIENMRVTYCTNTGIDLNQVPGSLIRNCQISKNTGSTQNPNGFGVYCSGDGLTVADCSVADIVATGGTSYGIELATGAFAVRNRISNANRGIYCTGGGKYQNNVTLNCTTPFSGGTDAATTTSPKSLVPSLAYERILQPAPLSRPGLHGRERHHCPRAEWFAAESLRHHDRSLHHHAERLLHPWQQHQLQPGQQQLGPHHHGQCEQRHARLQQLLHRDPISSGGQSSRGQGPQSFDSAFCRVSRVFLSDSKSFTT